MIKKDVRQFIVVVKGNSLIEYMMVVKKTNFSGLDVDKVEHKDKT